ncbi:NepR family anti-sigma factor [Martelella mediterranea]|uniref:NepR family anti-sigma factor n=1 Tax=Martelella mediterranea TaxID=293089 RepID=UPI00039B6B72
MKNNSDLEQGSNMPGTAKSPEEAISRRLKALYNAVEQEEIPDRFLDLLERLDAAEAASAPRKKG